MNTLPKKKKKNWKSTQNQLSKISFQQFLIDFTETKYRKINTSLNAYRSLVNTMFGGFEEMMTLRVFVVNWQIIQTDGIIVDT